ncbi:MAG: Asp-tRNA(Asn)/Glu-tRNA(Gln) amidotransferase subunit GatC [Candidatus Paceibacterota bacterium]|jgi:aspartyl-tRNA(Asn)/glutamyl-tRNA(Gln) amidotransferase subunit C
MITKEDITKLAGLARIELSDSEKEKLAKDVGNILGYVDQIKTVAATVSNDKVAGDLRNVMREDVVTTETGVNTETLLAEAPARDKNYLKVKKIL